MGAINQWFLIDQYKNAHTRHGSVELPATRHHFVL
jgi:hypothetical protein